MSCTYRVFQDKDEIGLQRLLKETFPMFRENDLWFWKYRLNPYFDSSIVVVAENEGEVVGSNYWLVRSLKLSGNLEVKTALGADVAVNPKFRCQGVGKELLRYPRVSGAFRDKGILLSYMFSSPSLTKRFQNPAAGYTSAPIDMVVYRKLLTCNELEKKFEEINNSVNSSSSMKEKLKKINLRILFKLAGAPEFLLSIGPERVYLTQGKLENANMLVEGKIPFSSLIIGESGGTGYLVKSWGTGKIKIKRGYTHILELKNAFNLFRLALSQKS